MEGYRKCCLCGMDFKGFGNNPWPLKDTDEQCCDTCNIDVVSARIYDDYLRRGKKYDKSI